MLSFVFIDIVSRFLLMDSFLPSYYRLRGGGLAGGSGGPGAPKTIQTWRASPNNNASPRARSRLSLSLSLFRRRSLSSSPLPLRFIIFYIAPPQSVGGGAAR